MLYIFNFNFLIFFFFFSSRRRHTRFSRDWSSDVCSSDLGQKGSSAMPHKRNPITWERLTGLARVLRGNAVAGLENVALWHERDISHSSVERIIFPDSCTLLDYMLATLHKLIQGLIVYPENMARNMEL